jgi:membrane fusion protein (multidrug efflux system)
MARFLLSNLPGELNQSKGRQWFLAAGAITAMALLNGCSKTGQAAGPEGPGGGMPPMPVTVMEAQPQRVPVLIEEVGQTEGSKDVEVRARVSGILTKQLYTEGDSVKEGATLFTIDRAPFEIALAQARAALAQAKADLEKAQREATRLKPLVGEKAVSQKELDDANTALQTAQAAVMVDEAKVRDAELNLSYTVVTAPISGVTGRAQQSQGSLISAGSASSLLTTMNIIDPIWVRFAFSESETRQLRQAGGKTTVKLSLPDGRIYDLPGKLNFTASTVNTSTGMVPFRAEFPNPKSRLLPGQFVRVQVSVGEREAYLVPQAALSQTEQGQILFTVAPDNTVAPRPVETDGWSGTDWVVTKGLTPGDKIIVDNLMKLRPGAPVMPHAPGEGPGAPAAGAKAPDTAKPDAAKPAKQ